MDPVVLFRSVVALVDRFPVLAGVDLSIERGESVLLTGANGAGKTSLLRAMAGLLSITEGQAEVLGYDVMRDRKALRRRVAYSGHAGFLYGDLTVRENVAFATRAAGSGTEAVEPALARMGLSDRLAGVQVDRLSAGQRRRTALAVLAARDAELWLLDEPHAGLDADARELLDDLLRDAVARGRTVVFSSHEIEQGIALSTRQIEIAGGSTTPLVDISSAMLIDGKGPTHVA